MRRPIEDTEADFMALLTDLDERMNALRGRVTPAQLREFDRRAEVAAKAINRAMITTFSFIQRADPVLAPRPRGGNVITLRPHSRRIR
jgi:hypothetical protein